MSSMSNKEVREGHSYFKKENLKLSVQVELKVNYQEQMEVRLKRLKAL